MPDGRFAPSPSGPLHLGSLRTALLAWLFARSSGSRFSVRMEDLDPVTHEGVAKGQLRDLAAIGLDWDGAVAYQSDRLDRYRVAIELLSEAGLLYRCYCTRREIAEAAVAPHEHLPEGAYGGTCRELTSAQIASREADGRPPALRLRADAVRVTFTDRLKGDVVGEVDDFVVCRNDGTPAYNLAVVVDDAAQGIGEVVRGDDLLLTTPRQIHLAAVLGLPVPAFAHVPLVLGPDGQRLAKRDGAIGLVDRTQRGESPAEVLALLAWSLGLCDAREEVTAQDLLVRFDPGSLPRQAWRLRPDEL